MPNLADLPQEAAEHETGDTLPDDAEVPATGGENGEDGQAPTLDIGMPPKEPPQPISETQQLPFQSWDRYQITAFLGAGGMGAVYKARDRRLKRSVAIKFLRSGGQAEAFDSRERRHFEREARAQARIEHPNICKIYEVGEVEGQPYIAMQLLRGSSLSSLHETLPREEKVRIILKVSEALHAAHTQNLIHRDIKPGNIIVEHRPDGTWWPYLMDFGLAKEVDADSQTSTSRVEGTPAYMAPEQARADTELQGVRTDVYGIGATLYHALAGRPPFVGTSTDVLIALLVDDPPRLRNFDPSIPPALETIVFKCLEKNPARRYSSAQALAEDLSRFLDGARIIARPPSLGRRFVRFSQRHRALVASISMAFIGLLILAGVTLRLRWQAAAQAKLAERLGQEIKDMEWLLRSARQLPLHDLDREKVIIRDRMVKLQEEIASYGQLGQGLAYYALGRGHMALHEYPQALAQLQQATRAGLQTAELHYALGFVLGKHFEQAIYEARLSGGGDWAKKQLKESEPKYLVPAIASLTKSRVMQLDAPQYLEALIAFYQRDYQAALENAEAAVKKAPWLYEPVKLSGDVHLERALQARDSGKKEEAEREFDGAIKSYEAAALIGQSDAEVYEGLAEAWVRRLEMARNEGQSVDVAYKEALSASGKAETAEPRSFVGSLKKAYASWMMATALLRTGKSPQAPLKTCLEAAEAVLKRQPGYPYASEVAAGCHSTLSEDALNRGEDPTPYLRKALEVLEPVIEKYPHFLWGINDLSGIYSVLGEGYQAKGHPSAKEMIQKSLAYAAAASTLDPTYLQAINNSLYGLRLMVAESRTPAEVMKLLSQADQWLGKCQAINQKDQFCRETHVETYTQAASRIFQLGQDPQPLLQRALAELAERRSLGDSVLAMEASEVLLHLIDAGDKLRHKQDPAKALAEVQASLNRCYALAANNPMCGRLEARAEWVRGEWLALQGQPYLGSLKAAQAKAVAATHGAENDIEAWQTLAEAHLRLARAQAKQAGERNIQLEAGLESVAKVFAINPNHALGLATQGALYLLRAQGAQDMAMRDAAALAAVALTKALEKDAVLEPDYAPLLQAARALAEPPK